MSDKKVINVEMGEMGDAAPSASDSSTGSSGDPPLSPSKYDVSASGMTNAFRSSKSYKSLEIKSTKDFLSKTEDDTRAVTLGTLKGVFFPVLQNIFGIILFIRLPSIVGEAGVGLGFLTVFLSCLTTFLTVLSLSAIATNGRLGGGGPYALISRNLGPEIGGAVGILFYLGTTIAATMYVLGAVEVIQNTFRESALGPGKLFTCSIANCYSGSGSLLNSVDVSKAAELCTDLASGNELRECIVSYNEARLYGTILAVLMASLVYVGIKYVSMVAPVFLACVLLSILSIFIGFFASDGVFAAEKPPFNNMETAPLHAHDITGLGAGNFDKNQGPMPVFTAVGGLSFYIGLFFPSCTGIMAGCNRSGDLTDAQKSIPKGTLAANLTTSTVYLLHVLLWGAVATREGLLNKANMATIVPAVSWPSKWLVAIGVILSSVGAGLQSLTGAPRLLQVIAQDNTIPILQKVSSPAGTEPKKAVILTWFICNLMCMTGTLEEVNPLITMFFLMCYAFVNFSTFLLSVMDTPNFRPSWKYYHPYLSLVGFFLCLAMMFITSVVYAFAAIVISVLIGVYIAHAGAKKNWGDGMRGLLFQTARRALLSVRGKGEYREHAKNFRPQLLVLTKTRVAEGTDVDESNPTGSALEASNAGLFSFANQMKKGRGLIIFGNVVKGSLETHNTERVASEKCIDRILETGQVGDTRVAKESIPAFSYTVMSPSVRHGLENIIQSTGLGEMVPNAVLQGFPGNWRSNPSSADLFVGNVRSCLVLNKCFLALRGDFPSYSENDFCRNSIDVWWMVHDGGLLLLLPTLLRRHRVWSGCSIRFFVVGSQEDESFLEEKLAGVLAELRIACTFKVVVVDPAQLSTYVDDEMRQFEDGSHRPFHSISKQTGLVRRLSRDLSRDSVEFRRSAMVKSSSHTDIKEEGEKSADAADAGSENDEVEGKFLHQMSCAVALNEVIRKESCSSDSPADLVILNLPVPDNTVRDTNSNGEYLDFVDKLTEKIPAVAMVIGSGTECVNFEG